MACDLTTLLLELRARELMLGASEAQEASAAEQARLWLAAYCGLPEAAALPNGLFYCWLTLTGLLLSKRSDCGAYRVASVSEGDRAISFEPLRQELPPECRAIADRYRRFL